MKEKRINRLERQRAHLAEKLGTELAAIMEAATAVVTTRMAERQRSTAQRYRDVVRQLATC